MSTKPPITEQELRAANAQAEQVFDALRECFIVASLGVSLAIQAGQADEFTDLLRKLGVRDGFGGRAMDLLKAWGIEAPDVALLDKRRGGH